MEICNKTRKDSIRETKNKKSEKGKLWLGCNLASNLTSNTWKE